MFSLMAGLAAASQQLPIIDDADFHCVVATSMVLGQMTDDKKSAMEDKAGVTAIFMYYVGKIDVRFPGIDYVGAYRSLVGRPGYLDREFKTDIERCANEAEVRGKTLQDIGNALQTAPLGGAGA